MKSARLGKKDTFLHSLPTWLLHTLSSSVTPWLTRSVAKDMFASIGSEEREWAMEWSFAFFGHGSWFRKGARTGYNFPGAAMLPLRQFSTKNDRIRRSDAFLDAGRSQVTWGPGLLGVVGVGSTLNFVVNSSRGGHEREDQRSARLIPSLLSPSRPSEPPFLTRDPFRDTRNMRAARRDQPTARQEEMEPRPDDRQTDRPTTTTTTTKTDRPRLN